MEWDLGLGGVGYLLAMAFAAAVVAQVFTWQLTRRLWLVATAVYAAIGLFVSEVWFGWATEEDLQPNIDGLSFDEVFLSGVATTVVTVLVARSLARRASHRAPSGPSHLVGRHR
jgi:hypothetical protein